MPVTSRPLAISIPSYTVAVKDLVERDAPDFWQACLSHFAALLPAQQFNTWILPLQHQVDEQSVSFFAPNAFILKWVRERFLSDLQSIASQHFERPMAIIFSPEIRLNTAVKETNVAAVTSKTKQANTTSTASKTNADTPAVNPDNTALNPLFTFDNLVEGNANLIAAATAKSVSLAPGVNNNPLIIYGGVGLGKSHLLHAIGHEIRARNPQARIRYVHAERYVSDVVRAYQQKSFDQFKAAYRTLDVLLIDDIQFFSNKSRTQEEFFYLFNTLVDAHKQVVLTCDTVPKSLEGIEPRLVSRFSWGLSVNVEPPEIEMRQAILHKKAVAMGMKLDSSVAFFIAEHIRANVRELEGALKRVAAHAQFLKQGITIAIAKEALRDLVAANNRHLSIDNIQKTVADFYKLRLSDLFSKSRLRQVARPRQVAMFLSKTLTQHSLPDIGKAFGGRDHSTVLHACKQIEKLKLESPVLAQDIQTLLKTLGH
jgi:chromosomal replication initiator protein